MSSFYEQNHGSTSLSRSMRGFGAENSRTLKNLDKELSRLEMEKKKKMRELDQASRNFLDIKQRASSARSRECSPDSQSNGSMPMYSPVFISDEDRSLTRSPSPNPKSPLDDLTPLSRCLYPKPQKNIYKRSSPTGENGTSSKHHSPSSSPESDRKLLSKRNDDLKILQKSHSITEATAITDISCVSPSSPRRRNTIQSAKTHNTKSSKCKSKRSHTSNPGIPQIIVSDTTPKLPDINPIATIGNPEETDDSADSSGNQSPTPYHADDVSDGCLHVPTRRSRSSSVPAIAPSTHHLLSLAKAESTFTTMTEQEASTEESTKLRPRSRSVCAPYYEHLKNAPRRDSLLRKYIARPKMYHRTAKTIDQLISDVAKGICNGDIRDIHSKHKTISTDEWDKLKLCRYLRMPTKNDQAEGKALNVEEIFPHSSSTTL